MVGASSLLYGSESTQAFHIRAESGNAWYGWKTFACGQNLAIRLGNTEQGPAEHSDAQKQNAHRGKKGPNLQRDQDIGIGCMDRFRTWSECCFPGLDVFEC